MTEVYIGLGSNLGDRFHLMCQAVGFLRQSGAFTGIRVSSLYETEPMGYTDQPSFLNAVVAGTTALTPEALLTLCQSLEQGLERVRTIRWGPRTIDADILIYGKLKQEAQSLTLPHPRMGERAFVLMPLLEVCSEEIAAYYDLAAALKALPDQGVRKLESYEATVEWNQ